MRREYRQPTRAELMLITSDKPVVKRVRLGEMDRDTAKGKRSNAKRSRGGGWETQKDSHSYERRRSREKLKEHERTTRRRRRNDESQESVGGYGAR